MDRSATQTISLEEFRKEFEKRLGPISKERHVDDKLVHAFVRFYCALARKTRVRALPVTQPLVKQDDNGNCQGWIEVFIFRVEVTDPKKGGTITLYDLTLCMTAPLNVLVGKGAFEVIKSNLSPLWRCVRARWNIDKKGKEQLFKRPCRPQLALIISHPCPEHEGCRDSSTLLTELSQRSGWKDVPKLPPVPTNTASDTYVMQRLEEHISSLSNAAGLLLELGRHITDRPGNTEYLSQLSMKWCVSCEKIAAAAVEYLNELAHQREVEYILRKGSHSRDTATNMEVDQPALPMDVTQEQEVADKEEMKAGGMEQWRFRYSVTNGV